MLNKAMVSLCGHSPSLAVRGRGRCHGPDRLQKGPHASRVGFDVVARGMDSKEGRCCVMSSSPAQWEHIGDCCRPTAETWWAASMYIIRIDLYWDGRLSVAISVHS